MPVEHRPPLTLIALAGINAQRPLRARPHAEQQQRCVLYPVWLFNASVDGDSNVWSWSMQPLVATEHAVASELCPQACRQPTGS